FAGEDKRLDVAQIVFVFLSEKQPRNRRDRRFDNALITLAGGREEHVGDHAVLAVGLAIHVERLEEKGLGGSEVVAFAFKVGLALGKLLNDLIDRNGWRRRVRGARSLRRFGVLLYLNSPWLLGARSRGRC